MTPQLLTRQIQCLLAARSAHLADRPVLEIAAAVGRVADRLLNPRDDLRESAEGAVEAVSGLSRPMVSRIIDGMAADWREQALRKLLDAEFGSFRALDGFVDSATTESRRRAFGPALTFHVFSGNVPGVGVTSLIRALLVKSASLAKTAVGEPVLAPLFARALAEEDAGLGSCLAITYWEGGDESLERCALEAADAVIAYGRNEAIESLRSRIVRPVPFLSYGHRVSFGIVAREALEGDEAVSLAEAAAVAVATFDQQGCVSPHLFYVEEGGAVSARKWAALVAEAMARVEAKLPRGRLFPGEAGAIQQARGEARFAQLAGSGHELYTSETGTAWSVLFDPDPTFSPSCLNRLVRIKPVADLDRISDYIAPLAGLLQTVGIAGSESRISALATWLGRMGASRITSLERMPWPPPAWHHDGRPPLRDLVRWCDWE